MLETMWYVPGSQTDTIQTLGTHELRNASGKNDGLVGTHENKLDYAGSFLGALR